MPEPPPAPRIPLLAAETARARGEEVGIPRQLAELNIFRLLLRRPQAAGAVGDLLLSMLFGGALDDRLRELVIMRIGWTTGADYEWTQHWTIARETFGCTEEDLLAVRDWREASHFDERERAVLAATDETLTTGAVTADTLDRCRVAVGDDACVELCLAIGAWHTVSQLARSLAVPLEEGIASWPPDGREGPGAH